MSNAFDKASLVMLPHAYEEGKLYSLKPTDRSGDFTFSRGTDTATRVGEDGYIKKEYANLLEQSNSFDTTWTTFNASVTSGQSGYDGSNDAWLLNATGASGVVKQTISLSGVQTFSIYAKQGTADAIEINSFSNVSLKVNLTDGSVITSGSANIDSSVTSISNGYYRITITANGSATIWRIYISKTSGSVTSGDNIYIQDAMLNPGLVAYPYLETTTAPVYGGLTDDMPRLDYSGGATCPSLLLEPSRTNLFGYSEYFGGWLVSPSYTNTTTQNKEGRTIKSLYGGCAESVTLPSAGTYSYSVYAKKDTWDFLVLRETNFATSSRTWFDLANGVVTSAGSSHGTPTITPEGNGWYRCTIYLTASTDLSGIISFTQAQTSGSTTSGTNDQEAIFVDMAQFEQGSYPTSYIPTYGSSQTRAYDNSTLLNIDTNIVDITGDFTFYLDNTGSLMKGTELYYYFIELYWDAITSIRYYSTSNGSWYYKPSNAYYGFNNSVGKQVIKYQNGVFYHFLNGTKSPSTGTMAVTNSLSKIQFFANTTGKAGYLNIKQALLFDSALSDSECIALTTIV